MSTRDRSASPRPHKRRRRDDRSPTPSDEAALELPHGANEITELDYFAKNDEFRVWLKEEKHRYFDELSGEKARSYFKKFVKAWNRGRLPKPLYAGIHSTTTSSASQTSFRWSFASNTNRAEREALDRARDEVDSLTYSERRGSKSAAPRIAGPSMPPPSHAGARVAGPTLPSASDMRLAQELHSDQLASERTYTRAADKREQKDRLEELAPREVGKERMMEKKREKRAGDREFRDGKEDAGLELPEETLLGGGRGDSFADRIRARDAARARFDQKKRGGQLEKEAERSERTKVMRDKESETMAMFQKMAKERFG